jgi:hypothetical protein
MPPALRSRRSISPPGTALLSAVALIIGVWLLVAPHAAAQGAIGLELGAPRASGDFGEAITFETTFTTAHPPRRVELLTRLPGEEGSSVSLADLEPWGADGWRASVVRVGHVVPNTAFEYAFRVVTDEGTATGPTGRHVVTDQRFDWERLAGDGVTVWWHDGDRAFADRALGTAEQAVDSAADLLGVIDQEAVDFFIYSDGRAFRQAMGPATRENVGGEAHPAIRTLFGLIEPHQVDSDWVEELITHEIGHIVFDEAVRNPYRYPPRWLNEGIAVYLSRGYGQGDRSQVQGAARTGSIIPLEGLAGQFPTRPIRFGLAYAESVSAVDHLVQTHGEDSLGRLVEVLGRGATLDEAMAEAIGSDLRAFEDSWLATLDAERPEPFGPRPGEPGPVPDAWAEPVEALLR